MPGEDRITTRNEFSPLVALYLCRGRNIYFIRRQHERLNAYVDRAWGGSAAQQLGAITGGAVPSNTIMGGIETGVGDSDSTQELCRRIREGDKAAEAALLGRLQPGLRLILRRATGGDLQLARELSQETLIIVLKRLRGPGLDDPSGVAAFAAQTARNLAIAERRKTWRRRTRVDTEALELTEDSGSAQVDQLANGRLGELVRRLLLQLPSDRDRLILTRFYLHEEDKATICRDLELSELAFNQVLFRARGRFRQLLSGAGLSKDDLLDSDMHHGS